MGTLHVAIAASECPCPTLQRRRKVNLSWRGIEISRVVVVRTALALRITRQLQQLAQVLGYAGKLGDT